MSQRLKADAGLTLCTALWGATFVVVKGALNSASVFAFMAVRFTLVAVLMAAIFRHYGEKTLPSSIQERHSSSDRSCAISCHSPVWRK